MSRPQQYDVFRPAALPSASLGRRPGALATKGDAAELDKVYDAWNVRIDKEVQAVAGGLRELVGLADLGETPTPNTHTLTALHLQLKTSSLIRAAQTLRDTAHELRLALALGDDIAAAGRRDAEAVGARREVDALRGRVAREFGNMVARVPVGEEQAQEGGEEKKVEKVEKDEKVETDGEKGAKAGQEKQVEKPADEPADEPQEEKMDVDDDEDEFEEV